MPLRHLMSLVLALLLPSTLMSAYSVNYQTRWQRSPFYLGAITGYGSTDWGMMVIDCAENDELCDPNILSFSAPLAAGDDGAVWGFSMGYEVKPFWAVETSFIRFPTSIVHKSPIYSAYDLPDVRLNAANFVTDTWALIFVGKFMTQIGHTGFRGFANAGLDVTHRQDMFTHQTMASATFGVGTNYVFQSDVMLELFFQYIAGYGRSNEKPILYYMPFLYTIGVKLLYRI